MNTNTDFKPGIYRHYKGGLYTALGLATHHETRCTVVLYISHTYGGLNVRPLCGYNGDMEAWNDLFVDKAGETFQRFTYVADVSDTPLSAL